MAMLRISVCVRRLVPSLVIAMVALAAFSPVGAWMPPLAFNRPAASDRIAPVFPGLSEQDLAVLDRVNHGRVTIALEDVSFEDAMRAVRKESQVPLWMDEVRVAQAGLDLNRLPIDLQVHDELVRDVLTKLFEPKALDWVLEDGVLKIFPVESACSPITPAAIYPVSDLVEDGDADYKELESVIMANTGSMWEPLDQEGGSIQRVTGARSLVIHQTYKAHAEIDRFLTALRAAKRIGREAMAPKAALADEPLFVPASSHGRPTP